MVAALRDFENFLLLDFDSAIAIPALTRIKSPIAAMVAARV
jgi:hypothetical protein